MKKTSRILAALAAGAMAVSLMPVSAMADENSTGIDLGEIDFSTWATAADNGMDLPEIEDGTLEITANIPDFNMSSEGTQIQALWEQAMEHYLGVDIDVTFNRTAWADYRTNELTLLAAGDVADVNTYSYGTSSIVEYGDDGVVLNLADYQDYIKYYWDYVDGHPNGRTVASTADGNIYYFMDGMNNEDNIQGAQSFTAFAYRFDVLQELGLEPATTLDEFTQLCADLQAKIDDGTIDADYVIFNSDANYAFYRGFVGIFHTWDTLYWNGTEWAFGPIEDNFREMLKYLNSLYAAGYIDPEFATADGNTETQKATTGSVLICPTLWAGMAASWNTAASDDSGIEWGLAYLPENTDYGTAWKWGSKLPGKNLNTGMGIYISGETEYPEYMVAMIDYQYSDEMTNLLNWGVEGKSYTVDEDGNKTYVDAILDSDSPANASAELGLMASAVCRTGIPFTPQNFSAMLQVASLPEPWWSEEDGYFESKYWIESDRQGGEDSVSPADRPAVTTLDTDQSEAKSQLQSACETYAKEEAIKFITGEYDPNDDAAWESYVEGVKSQSDEDFDETIQMLNDNSVVETETETETEAE